MPAVDNGCGATISQHAMDLIIGAWMFGQREVMDGVHGNCAVKGFGLEWQIGKVTDNDALARRTAAAVDEQVETLPRATIARKALESRGAIFVARSLEEAAGIADHIAPEHLVLAVAQPDPLLRSIRVAGAVFVGYGTPQVVGDYVAGPSHTLPTGGCARFASPLGVHTFLVRTSLVRYGAEALRRDAPTLRALASVEGLGGHWRSVERRLTPSGKSGD